MTDPYPALDSLATDPETAATNEADRHAHRAENTVDRISGDWSDATRTAEAAQAQVHATLAVAAEVRALRVVFGSLLELLDTVLTDESGTGIGSVLDTISSTLENR